VSFLEWYSAGSPQKPSNVQKAMRGTWVCCEVWPNESGEDWTWKVGMGGPHGMNVIGFAPTELEAKKEAEIYLRGVLQALLGDGAK
jgi:hypothetical protein